MDSVRIHGRRRQIVQVNRINDPVQYFSCYTAYAV